MKVAVVIVNWNSGEYLERCLCALEKQELLPSKVIIVDNCSQDDSLLAVENARLNTVVLRLQENVGFARANNLALSECTDIDWIATLNADAFADPRWLMELMQATMNCPEYSFFASCMLKDANTDFYDGAGDNYFISGLAKRRNYLKRYVPDENESREVFAPCAAAALYRKDAWQEVQGFDEDFFCFFEDVDLGFRLRLKGHKCLYVADAVVRHVGGGLTQNVSSSVVMYGHRNLVWAYFKNMPLLLLLVFLPVHALVNLVSIMYYLITPHRSAILQSKWQALLGLPKFLRKRSETQAGRVSSRVLLNSMTWRLW